MPVTLVVTATPNSEATADIQAYTTGAAPLLIKGGGELVFRGKTSKAIKGNANFAMLLVMNFASEEIIEEIFASAEYKALIPHRERAFKQMDIIISHSS
jgi:uncharacterized protein (DUF1330 family)